MEPNYMTRVEPTLIYHLDMFYFCYSLVSITSDIIPLNFVDLFGPIADMHVLSRVAWTGHD